MTRTQFIQHWRIVTGDSHHSGTYWKAFRNDIKQDCYSTKHMVNWKENKMIEGKNITATEIRNQMNNIIQDCIAPLQTATCTNAFPVADWTPQYYQQEGINPMYASKTAYTTPMSTGDLTINLAPAASASMMTKSDTAIQRDYLMQQLDEIDSSIRYGKMRAKLRDAFNLDVNNAPKTSQALIDAISGGKFKLDDRILKLQAAGEDYDEFNDEYVGSPYAAIIWDGPTPDKTGFDAALETLKAQLKSAKHTIVVKSPDEGLAAILALEAWTPTTKAN